MVLATGRVGFRDGLLPFASPSAASTASRSSPREICGWSLFFFLGTWCVGDDSCRELFWRDWEFYTRPDKKTKTCGRSKGPGVLLQPRLSLSPLEDSRRIKKEAAGLISFLGRAKTNSVKPDTWQGKKSLSKASPPRRRPGLLTFSSGFLLLTSVIPTRSQISSCPRPCSTCVHPWEAPGLFPEQPLE